MKIPLVNLSLQHEELFDEVRDAIDRVIESSEFAGGEEVEAFEGEFAAWCAAAECVAVSSYESALVLSLTGLGVGSGNEIIAAVSASGSVLSAIRTAGALAVLVDHDADTLTIDPRRIATAVTSQTKAILVQHRFGHPAAMAAIQAIAGEHGLAVIEDVSEAHGARVGGQRCGTIGHVGVFGFGPRSNMGAIGRAGALVTGDARLADRLRRLRIGGDGGRGGDGQCRHWAMDAVQAAVLRVKLPHVEEWNRRRRSLAGQYGELGADTGVSLPVERRGVEHVYGSFVVMCDHRDGLSAWLGERGIETARPAGPMVSGQSCARGCAVVGPTPFAQRAAGRLLALPMCPFLSLDTVEDVAAEFRAGLCRLSRAGVAVTAGI